MQKLLTPVFNREVMLWLGVSIYNLLINEIENHVHVTEPAPADPDKFACMVSLPYGYIKQLRLSNKLTASCPTPCG